jgi:hypothetical protein
MFIEINSKTKGRELIEVRGSAFKMLRILKDHLMKLGYRLEGMIECDNRRWNGEYQATSSSDELTICIL